MPRFADWAAEKKPPPAQSEVKLETFLLVNDFLQTEKKGIKYRKSRRMDDIHESRSAQFGKVVSGVRVGKEGRWLKIGKLFLPMKVSGKPVLIPPEDAPRSPEKQHSAPELPRRKGELEEYADELEAQLRAYNELTDIYKGHGVGNPLSEKAQIEAERLNELLAKFRKSPVELRRHQMMMAGEWLKIAARSAGETAQEVKEDLPHPDGHAADSCEDPVKSSAGHNKEVGSAEEDPVKCSAVHDNSVGSAKEADRGTPALEPAPGAPYTVCYEKVLLRHLPTTEGLVIHIYKKGDVVTLFDWDETGKWRKCLKHCFGERPEDHKFEYGWVMLDHHDWGPLLRPLGKESDSCILKPLCMAASENHVSELQRFISEGWDVDVRDHHGKTPLMLAAEQGHLDCCVSLLEGRANASLLSNTGERALDLALTGSAKGIIILLSEPYAAFEWLHAGDDEMGKWFSAALELLQPKTRLAANRVVAKLAAERQRANALRRAELGALESEEEVTEVEPEFGKVDLEEEEAVKQEAERKASEKRAAAEAAAAEAAAAEERARAEEEERRAAEERAAAEAEAAEERARAEEEERKARLKAESEANASALVSYAHQVPDRVAEPVAEAPAPEPAPAAPAPAPAEAVEEAPASPGVSPASGKSSRRRGDPWAAPSRSSASGPSNKRRGDPWGASR